MNSVRGQVVSEAARQLPEEVYKAPKPGAAKGGEVVGKAERKRARAAHKRGFKKRLEQEVRSTSVLVAAEGDEGCFLSDLAWLGN